MADIAPPGELTCKELVELVTEYCEDTLSPAERARFEAHLLTCPYCRIYVAQIRQTINALGKLTEESLDPRTKESLLGVFRDWKRGQPDREDKGV
jgi:anti-sigma factor RsiW